MKPGILVVDDDAGIRETLRLILEDAGYHVREAADAEAAIQIIQSDPSPMIVLLDLIMPRSNGMLVLDIVRQDDSLRQKKACIVMTAAQRNLPDTLAPIVKELAIAIMYKPFELETLINLVADAETRLSTR